MTGAITTRSPSTRPLAKPGPLQVTNFLARSEQAFSPRLSALFRAKENLVFRASIYRAFRPPTLERTLPEFSPGKYADTRQ